MDHRAHVYSPLQNIAVWLAAWLHGHVSTDECLDAMAELGGQPYLVGTDPEDPAAGLELMKVIRRIAAAPQDTDEPIVQLVLTGPGEAVGLHANTASYSAAQQSGVGALVFPQVNRQGYHVLVPVRSLGDYLGFQLFAETEALPAPPYLSPGEADIMLADATRSASRLITEQDVAPPDLPNPRLTVGTLADFYDTPGLPYCTPPRAAKLFARADRVAAIIETVGNHVGSSTVDPFILPLMRHVRAARVAGVAYVVKEMRNRG